jgi:hypothetical protein
MDSLKCPECGETKEFEVCFKEEVMWPLTLEKGKDPDWGSPDILGYESGEVIEVRCCGCEHVFELTEELEEFILGRC